MLPADVLSDVMELCGMVESEELDIVIEVVESVGISTALPELRLTLAELLWAVKEVATSVLEYKVGSPMLRLTEVELL